MTHLLVLVFIWLADVQQLGDTRFKVREAAQHKLAVHNDRAIVALHLGEGHPDPEIRYRCRLLVDQWYRCHAAAIAANLKPKRGWPRIDYGQLNGQWEEPTDLQVYHFQIVLDLNYPRVLGGQFSLKNERDATKVRLVELIETRQDFRGWLRLAIAFDRELRKK